MITSAIFGVILIFGSYLILNTINPSLTILQEPGLPRIPATPQGGNSPVSCNAGSIYPVPNNRSDAVVRGILAQSGITVNRPTDCANLCTDLNCTSLDYMPFSVISGLANIKNGCEAKYGKGSCDMVITGGTEVASHQTHGPDKPIVDLRWNPNLDQYILDNASSLGVTQVCTMPPDKNLNCSNFNEGIRQIHLQFSS